MTRINLGNNEVRLYPGGGGYATKFYTGRLRPEVHPSPLDRPHMTKKKGIPFVLFDKNGTVFTYLV